MASVTPESKPPNITADAQADGKRYAGKLSINDPNADASVEGIVDLEQAIHRIHLTADINHITPSRLKLFTGKLADADYRASLSANISGNDLNHATGEVNVTRFTPERGFLVESRRGSGGFVRIVRMEPKTAQQQPQKEPTASELVEHLQAQKLVTAREGALLQYMLHIIDAERNLRMEVILEDRKSVV